MPPESFRKVLEPWQWPEEEWRRRVNHVRAGRSLRPESWPGGKRCAVALSFDSDHDTNELRDGGKSIGRMSWGQYGNRVGVAPTLELLKRTHISATLFVPAVSVMLSEWLGSSFFNRSQRRMERYIADGRYQ